MDISKPLLFLPILALRFLLSYIAYFFLIIYLILTSFIAVTVIGVFTHQFPAFIRDVVKPNFHFNTSYKLGEILFALSILVLITTIISKIIKKAFKINLNKKILFITPSILFLLVLLLSLFNINYLAKSNYLSGDFYIYVGSLFSLIIYFAAIKLINYLNSKLK